MPTKWRNAGGEVEAGGDATSATDTTAASMWYTALFAHFGAKGTGGATIGVKLWTLIAGVRTLVATLSGTTMSIVGLLDLSAPTAGQIKFPAAQNASADPNTMDDYEEGTCSVTLGPLSSGSTTLSNSTLAYTKKGREVSVTGTITVSAVVAPVGHLRLDGLPFAVKAGTAYAAPMTIMASGLAAGATTAVVGSATGGSSNALLLRYSAGVLAELAPYVQVGTEFTIGITYFAN